MNGKILVVEEDGIKEQQCRKNKQNPRHLKKNLRKK